MSKYMTPEEQKAADAASAEAKAAEEVAKAEKEKADADASKDDKANVDKHKIDYEAELKAETERAERAEKALADKRFKDAEKKRKTDDAGADSDDDKPITRKELEAVRLDARREVQGERALELARDMAESDAEANLIVAKWKNRSFPEGTPLSEQVEEMYAVVHRKRLIGERNEALRALKGKDGINRNGASAHQDAALGKEPKLSDQDEQAIKAAGFTWNSVARQFEKKLTNGDTLVRDSKTKQTRLVKKAK